MLIQTLIPMELCVPESADAELALTAAQRRRVRQRLYLGAVELGLALPAGTQMHPGDQLIDSDGRRYRVCAAAEPVLRITAASALQLTRAAYHLGNRHVAVEVGDGYLAIEPDPVLAEMLTRLGVVVTALQAPFAPETGAYGGGHKHGHDATFGEDYQLAQSAYALHALAPAPPIPARSGPDVEHPNG
jgi:urease accessory protein